MNCGQNAKTRIVCQNITLLVPDTTAQFGGFATFHGQEDVFVRLTLIRLDQGFRVYFQEPEKTDLPRTIYRCTITVTITDFQPF